VLLKCKKCELDNAFKVEEMFTKNGLLNGVTLICSSCGEVVILPVEKEQEFRLKIRAKQNNKCLTCDKENPGTLHHRDSNNKNNSEDNLVLMCGKCHRKLNRVRDLIRDSKPMLQKEIMRYLKTVGLELSLLQESKTMRCKEHSPRKRRVE